MPPDVVIPSQGSSPDSPYAFGEAVAAWGDELLIGAPYGDYGMRSREGIVPPSACLFRRSGRRWDLVQAITESRPERAEGFARAVALGASFLVVGAPGIDNAGRGFAIVRDWP